MEKVVLSFVRGADLTFQRCLVCSNDYNRDCHEKKKHRLRLLELDDHSRLASLGVALPIGRKPFKFLIDAAVAPFHV